MSVTLIAVVIALAVGHLAPSLAAAMRRFGWYGHWLRWLDAHLGKGGFWRGQWGIVIALLPPLALVLALQVALDVPPLGLAAWLFAILVLFLAWGPRDLDRDVDAMLDAADPEARRAAAQRLMPGDTVVLHGGLLVESVFRSALRRWFGVLFWFLLLGPFGAVLYRLVALAAHGDDAGALPPHTLAGARRLQAVLDWPVAQLMTLALALVGNFDGVLRAWQSHGGASLSLRGRFLGAAGRACVHSELAEEAAEEVEEHAVDVADDAALEALAPDALPELRDAMSLVWRVLLVWLAVLALFVIAGFL